MKKILLTFACLFAINAANAQGPGGIDTTNMTLWVKSNVGITYDADSNISLWTDQSNYGNDLKFVGTTNRPNFKYQLSTYNNQNVVFFSVDSSDVLKSDAFPAVYDMTGGGWSLFLFFLYNKGSSQTGAGWFSTADALSAPKIQLNLNGNNFQLRGDAASNKVSLGSSVFTEPIVYSLVRSVSAGTIVTKQSGTEDASKSLSSTAAYQANLFKLGEDYASASFSEMQVTEVIFLNRLATSMEVQMVENYFSSKYGAPLTGSDLYIGDAPAQGDYDFDISGIGSDGTSTKTTSTSAGLTATVNANFGTNDYLFFGHKTASNSRNRSDTAGIGGSGVLAARFERTWYFDDTETTTGDNTVDLTFDLGDADYTGGTNADIPSNYVLLYRSGQSGTWTVVSTANSITNTDQINFTGVNLATNGDGYYTLGTKNAGDSPLPIELLSFTGSLQEDVVKLRWVTGSERNNDYFEVQRSTDGINWRTIGTQAGSGNSVNLLTYNFTDNFPEIGVNYYRLKQTDINGEFYQTQIIKVVKRSNEITYVVRPNPSQGIFELIGEVKNPEKMYLINSMGMKMKVNYTVKEGGVVIDATGLKPGVYSLLIPTAKGYTSKKVIIQP